MPGYPIPAPASLAGMLDVAERMRLLQQNAQDEADRNFARTLTPLIYGATPETVTAEVPATPPMNVTTLQPGEDPEAAAQIPTIPGQPASSQQISAHTPASLMQAAGGPEAFARMARTPEGVNAVNFMQPISKEELERRRRRATGQQEFRQHTEEEKDKYAAGDIEGAALSHMAAIRAMMESVDDPTKLSSQYEHATDRWKEVRSDAEQKRLAADDMKAITEAQRDLVKNHDDPAAAMKYVTALMEAKSTYAKSLAGHLLPEAFRYAAKSAQESGTMQAFSVVWGDIWQKYTAAEAKGVTPDLQRLSQDALQAHPKETALLQQRVWQDPKKVPDFFWKVLFPGVGQAAPKSDREMAMRAVENDPKRPLKPTDPGYWDAVMQKYAELERLRKRSPQQEAALNESMGALAASRRARAAAAAEAAKAKGAVKGESINALTLSMKRLKELRTSPDLTEDDRLHIDQEIADLQTTLDHAIKNQRPGATPPATGAAATPGAAPAKAQTRRIPRVGGKTVEVTEPPDGEITEEAALAEGQRLLKQYGLTKSQVIDAMKRAGWDVE